MEQNFKIAVPEGCKAVIEERYGEISISFKKEKDADKWEPKDGDFIAFGADVIGIFKEHGKESHASYVVLSDGCLYYDSCGWGMSNMRPATEEEKERLFDALAKEGKRWNAKEKRIEDLPRWRALYKENYYFIGSELTVDCQSEIGHVIDDNRYNAGNYFKTGEAAEKVANKLREIFKNSKAE